MTNSSLASIRCLSSAHSVSLIFGLVPPGSALPAFLSALEMMSREFREQRSGQRTRNGCDANGRAFKGQRTGTEVAGQTCRLATVLADGRA